MTIQCACKNCVCKPICRHKGYFTISDCELLEPLFGTVFNTDRNKAPHIVQKQIIIECLKPTTWSINQNGWINTGSSLI
jgi:hypothetical protein